MKKSLSFFLIASALVTALAVPSQPSSRSVGSAVALRQLRSDEPPDVRDPLERLMRLLQRVFHVGTNADGMTPPKP